MSQVLKSVPATVLPDGTVTLKEPLSLQGPALAMLTVVVDEEEEFTPEEVQQILEASEDLRKGNMEAFVPLSEVKARFAKS